MITRMEVITGNCGPFVIKEDPDEIDSDMELVTVTSITNHEPSASVAFKSELSEEQDDCEPQRHPNFRLRPRKRKSVNEGGNHKGSPSPTQQSSNHTVTDSAKKLKNVTYVMAKQSRGLYARLHDGLTCVQCELLAISPVQSCESGHLTCGMCFSSTKSCNMDKCGKALNPCPFAENLLRKYDEGPVPCRNAELGCGAKVTLWEMLEHLKNCHPRYNLKNSNQFFSISTGNEV
jgi:hypothetical protein